MEQPSAVSDAQMIGDASRKHSQPTANDLYIWSTTFPLFPAQKTC